MKLLSADDRMAEPRGAKILIVGQSGAGKTSLLRTLDSTALDSTLFVDCEGGDLSVLGLPVASVRPQTWLDLRDIACVIGGENPARPANAPYGHDHYRSVIDDPVLASLATYRTIFIDSLTQAMRLCRLWAEAQPESFNDRGRKDLRGTYGLVAREGVGFLQQCQRGRSKNIIFVAVLERHVDGTGFAVWRPQIEGARTASEMPAIIDVIVTLEQSDFFGDGKPTRAFVCANPNFWDLPARDRSGKLDQLEPPNLQHLLDKLLNPASAPGNAEGGK